MKKFLLRLALPLFVACAMLIGIVQLTGHATPQTIFAFERSDCTLPCVYGITPGITTWADYTTLLTASGPISPLGINRGHSFSIKDDNGTSLELLADYYGVDNSKKTISYVSASTPAGKVTSFGSLINAQQTPVRVFRARPFGQQAMLLFFVFGSDQRIIASSWIERELSPNTPITFLAVFDSADTANHVLLNTLSVDEISWQGFGSITKYADASVKQ